MCGTLDSHHREEAERNDKEAIAVRIRKSSAAFGADTFGNIIGGAAATAARARLHDLIVEDYRIHRFKHSDGKIRIYAVARQIGTLAEIVLEGIAFENADVSLRREKNDSLFYNGDTRELLRHTITAHLKGHLNVNAYIYLIKAAIERHGAYIEISPDYLSRFRPYGLGTRDELLTEIGEVNSHVLIAILIAAGIEHSVRVYTDCFAALARLVSIIISVLGHGETFLLI